MPGKGDRDRRPGASALSAVARLDEITDCDFIAAQAIIAEIGLDMTVFGTPGRLVSWAMRCPQTRQSGKKTTSGKAGKGNRYRGAPAMSSSRARRSMNRRTTSRTARPVRFWFPRPVATTTAPHWRVSN